MIPSGTQRLSLRAIAEGLVKLGACKAAVEARVMRAIWRDTEGWSFERPGLGIWVTRCQGMWERRKAFVCLDRGPRSSFPGASTLDDAEMVESRPDFATRVLMGRNHAMKGRRGRARGGGRETEEGPYHPGLEGEGHGSVCFPIGLNVKRQKSTQLRAA